MQHLTGAWTCELAGGIRKKAHQVEEKEKRQVREARKGLEDRGRELMQTRGKLNGSRRACKKRGKEREGMIALNRKVPTRENRRRWKPKRKRTGGRIIKAVCEEVWIGAGYASEH